MRAYVLVKVKVGSEREVMESLKGIPSIREITILLGDFDYILTIDAPDTTALSRLVARRIRNVEGVDRTATLIEAPI